MTQSRSKQLFEAAQKHIPGGVNSPVRAFRAVGGTPVFFDRAKGPYMYDADGKRYIDYIGSWGPMILGHGHPAVLEAVQKAAVEGFSFGAPTEREVELVEALLKLVPSMEMVRLVSSGTEAGMSALRLARGATGRSKIIKFEGCYHGHVDALLVKAGSGLVTFGTSSSAGVPEAFANETIVLPLNDLAALEACFEANHHDLAAVIIEPIPANNGLILHRRHMIMMYNIVVSCGCNENVSFICCIFHGYNAKTFHSCLQRTNRIDFCNPNLG